jgi:hypothetical protein
MYPTKRCDMNFAIVVGTQFVVAVQILVQRVRTQLLSSNGVICGVPSS